MLSSVWPTNARSWWVISENYLLKPVQSINKPDDIIAMVIFEVVVDAGTVFQFKIEWRRSLKEHHSVSVFCFDETEKQYADWGWKA